MTKTLSLTVLTVHKNTYGACFQSMHNLLLESSCLLFISGNTWVKKDQISVKTPFLKKSLTDQQFTLVHLIVFED